MPENRGILVCSLYINYFVSIIYGIPMSALYTIHPLTGRWGRRLAYLLLFSLVYGYLWWVILDGRPLQILYSIFFTTYSIKFFFYILFYAVSVAVNLYVLIPLLLEKGRYTAYILAVVLLIVISAAGILPGYYITAALYHTTVPELFGWNGANPYRLYFNNPLPSVTAYLTLAMSVQLAGNWIRSQKRQQALEKEKLETELSFLRYQFNPHFLFNTINSIFFLIHKDPYRASDSLAKFSDLLRYQLYECNDEQIPLSAEISYMENFIELEKLRQNENVEVNLEIRKVNARPTGIAPFILMTFVENAFKHVSKSNSMRNWIRIRVGLDLQHMDFHISNSTSPDLLHEAVHYGGIGLRNVKRRLDLIYPGSYQLDVQKEADSFSVRLQLILPELEIREKETGATVFSSPLQST